MVHEVVWCGREGLQSPTAVCQHLVTVGLVRLGWGSLADGQRGLVATMWEIPSQILGATLSNRYLNGLRWFCPQERLSTLAPLIASR